MLCISAACRHAVSVSVSVSVTFVNCVKTNKHIIKSPSARAIIPVFFQAKRHSNTPTETPLTGASNAGGVGKNRDYESISGFSACC